MRTLIFIFLIAITWQVSVVHAGEFEQGLQFFEKKNYAKAKALWEPLAENGDARAQYNLSLLLYQSEPSKIKEASQYMAMSRSNALVDGYFVKVPKVILNIEPGVMAGADSQTWLRQQSKSSYTLQLATGKSHKSMEQMKKNLISSHKLTQPQNLYTHKIERIDQGKKVIRFVLVYGVFTTYQDAKDETEKLPESIKKSSPWIRQLGVIQSIVNTNQKKKS